jgi:type II secretory pathway component PulF
VSGAALEVDDAEELARPSVPRRALTEATRSLSALLAAGLPLTKAIETTRDVVGGELARVLDAVLDDVRGGKPLAQSLGAHPDVFGPLYVGVVRAGERSGRLGRIVDRLADELERQDELRSRIVSASIYPAALVVLGGASVLVLLVLVVPRFGALLLDAGAELPPVTAGLLSLSDFVRSSWMYLAALGLAVGSAVAAAASSPTGREHFSRLLLGLPVIGPVRRGLLAARFSRLLGVLLEGGAPLVTGLADAAESLADPVGAREVDRIREEVRVGTSFHRSVASGSVFPSELARLVAVGEESGRLAEFLGRAADLFERRSMRAMERAVTLLEPVVIVVFGGLVAIVALALLQAIYGVNAGTFG